MANNSDGQQETTVSIAFGRFKNLSACPILSKFEVHVFNIMDHLEASALIGTGSDHIFQMLERQWETLNGYFREGLFPTLKVMRLIFDFTKSRTHFHAKCEIIRKLRAQVVLGDAAKRGIRVEVEFRYNSRAHEYVQ